MEEKRKYTRKKPGAEKIEKRKRGNEPLKILEGSFPFKPGEGDLGAFRQKSRRMDVELGKLSLTEKQSIVLDFITHHINVVGFPPTVRQISEYFGISPKAGHDHIRSIAKKGYLRLFPGSARGMELVHNPHKKELQSSGIENMDEVTTIYSQKFVQVSQIESTLGIPIRKNEKYYVKIQRLYDLNILWICYLKASIIYLFIKNNFIQK